MADKKIIKFSRKRNKKLAKKIYRIVRIPLAVLAVIFAMFLSARMLGEVAVSNISDAFRQIPYIFSHGSGYPCSVDAAGNIRAELIGDSPAVLGSGSLTVYSSSARKMNETQLSSADSKIVSKNGRALLYSNTSNTLNLSGKTESLGSLTVDSPVTVAALASNGSVAAAFSSEQAQSVLAVYNKRSKEIFRWNCSKEYISAVDLSRSGRTVAVSAVGAENAQIYSRFLIFDVKKSEPRVDIKVDGAMILRLVCGSSGKVIAVCDNRTLVYDKSGGQLLELAYGDGNLVSAVSDDKGNTLVCYKDSGGSKINAARISAAGKLTCTVTAEAQPDCVAVRAGRFVLVSGKTAVEYGSAGQERRRFETAENASLVMLASSCVYTLENSQLCKY